MDSETFLLLYECFLVSPEGRAFRHDITVLTNQCFHMVQNFKGENNVDRKSNLNSLCVCVYIYMSTYAMEKKKSGNSEKDLHVASHQIEICHMNWQQKERRHELE